MSALGNYIRQIEGLQDALTKRNARIAELEKLLDVYIEIGERRAEERIIKLLENETLETTPENTRANYDKLVWAGIREQLIALIKGENK